jgi:predicted lipoprotein with Yx(FWY)xxD motif
VLSESRRLGDGRRRVYRRVRRTWLAALTAAALGCALASCAHARPAADAPGTLGPGQQAVFVRTLPGIGPTLVDRSGRTIYSPQQEASGKIACTGRCLAFWFPVTVRPGTILGHPRGLGGRLGKIRRPDDGLTQLTYNGRPLYTFRLDRAAGQAHGNNFTDHFGAVSFNWRAVTAANHLKAKPGASPTAGGYTYPGTSPGY